MVSGKRGQAGAFVRSAYARHDGDLRRFLLRRIGNPDDVRELVQEVYLRLLRADLSQVRHPWAYIHRVATHVAHEFHIREKRRRVDFDSEAADAGLDLASRQGDGEAGALVQQQVRDALAGLGPQHLAVLLLERREGLSHDEIAKRLDLSPHTVKKYSVQALARVRESLERQA